MKTIKITAENFEENVLKNPQLTIVDFWAPWCAPCLDFAPRVEQLAQKYEGRATIGKLNVDENHKKRTEYGVTTIPTLISFKEGEEVARIVGRQPQHELEALIETHLNA